MFEDKLDENSDAERNASHVSEIQLEEATRNNPKRMKRKALETSTATS